jgi:hypothetical protein
MCKLNGRIILLIIILFSATSLFAQSGRPTRKNSPVPTPSPTPEPIQPKTERPAAIQMVLAIDQPNVYNNPPEYVLRIVFEACLERLNHARDLSVIPASPLSRQDAIKMAKRQKETFVVWLEVGNDASEMARSNAEDTREFFVGYFVYEPETGKVRKGGRQRHRTDQAENGGILPPGSPRGLRNAERVYKEAGYAAAERILEIFGVRP